VGDQFKICVALPKNYADTMKRYPAVYLLDANIFFWLVTDTVRLLQFGHEIPELVLVGIGYPDDDQHLTLRNRDYALHPTIYQRLQAERSTSWRFSGKNYSRILRNGIE